MAWFASVAELKTFTQDSSIDDSFAELVLELVTDAIKTEARQQLEKIENDTYSGQGEGEAILLPEIPVIAVSVVEVDGVALGATDYELDKRAGILTRTNSRIWTGLVEVTYTHGFDPIPPTIKLICLTAARRIVRNPEGYHSAVADDTHLIFAPELVLDEGERRILSRFRA